MSYQEEQEHLREKFRTKPSGYVVHGHKQGIIGVVLAMNGGTLVHLRYADDSGERIEQTEFWGDRGLETVARGISISFSDFDLVPIVLDREVSPPEEVVQPSMQPETELTDEEFLSGPDDLE